MEIRITSLGTFWRLAGETVFIGTMIRGGVTGDSAVENPSAMQETWRGFDPWVGKSPGGENGNALSNLAQKIPWTEEPNRLQSMGSQRVTHDQLTNAFIFNVH